MKRTIVVGDVHGCRAELEDLLARVAFAEGDRLVLVGDLVVRGPDPAGVLDLARSLGARAVLGNHEDRLLRIRAGTATASDAHRTTLALLGEPHLAYLATFPLWLDLPEHDLRVVHGGVVPGVAIEEQDPRALLCMRSLDANGGWLERRGATVWGARYDGPPHVVFGHNAQPEPQIHPWATGLDTGCVYGNALTALVLADGSPAPPPRDRRDALVSVRAKKAYSKANLSD